MEFERQTFRFHKRVLEGPSTKNCLLLVAFISFCNLTFGCFNLVVMHSNYVNTNDILKPQIEKQLKAMFYHQHQLLALSNQNFQLLFEHINKSIELNQTYNESEVIFKQPTR
jgi:hypothetical protein